MLGLGTALQGCGGCVLVTFCFVVPYSLNHTNNGTTGTIKTAYPVKKDQKSTVKINSLINATPLNSYGYRYIFHLQPHPRVAKR
ncbi:MgpC family cytadherence protein, partial [Mycoplasmoides genitalium]